MIRNQKVHPLCKNHVRRADDCMDVLPQRVHNFTTSKQEDGAEGHLPSAMQAPIPQSLRTITSIRACEKDDRWMTTLPSIRMVSVLRESDNRRSLEMICHAVVAKQLQPRLLILDALQTGDQTRLHFTTYT